MFKRILVPGLNAVCDARAMDLAVNVAQLFEGSVDYLHVHPDARELTRYLTPAYPETALYSAEICESILVADKKCAARSHQVIDALSKRERTEHDRPVAVGWREIDGNSYDQTIANGFYYDLLVLGRPAPGDLTTTDVIDVLLNCGRPVLLAPNATPSHPLSTVVIGWKPSASAARAVAAALPLLAQASKIHILGIEEDSDAKADTLRSAERLAEHLRSHGLKPQAGHVVAADRDPADVLVDSAVGLRGGLLVMGAYGHSRAREFVFGGFTRRVLHSSPLPVLLTH